MQGAYFLFRPCRMPDGKPGNRWSRCLLRLPGLPCSVASPSCVILREARTIQVPLKSVTKKFPSKKGCGISEWVQKPNTAPAHNAWFRQWSITRVTSDGKHFHLIAAFTQCNNCVKISILLGILFFFHKVRCAAHIFYFGLAACRMANRAIDDHAVCFVCPVCRAALLHPVAWYCVRHAQFKYL